MHRAMLREYTIRVYRGEIDKIELPRNKTRLILELTSNKIA